MCGICFNELVYSEHWHSQAGQFYHGLHTFARKTYFMYYLLPKNEKPMTQVKPEIQLAFISFSLFRYLLLGFIPSISTNIYKPLLLSFLYDTVYQHMYLFVYIHMYIHAYLYILF